MKQENTNTVHILLPILCIEITAHFVIIT